MTVEIDVSEVREFVAEMQEIPAQLARHVRPVVEKGAHNSKTRLQDEMRGSRHFAPVARGISYDIVDDGYGAEIGPVKGSPGSLANIPYFGSSRGGGGTVADPRGALEAEVPRFSRALADLAADLMAGR